jgi:hypothetical protein
LSNDNFKKKYPDSNFKTNFNDALETLYVSDLPLAILSQSIPSHSELDLVSDKYNINNNHLTKINISELNSFDNKKYTKVFIICNDNSRWIIGSIVDKFSDGVVISQCRCIERLLGTTYLLNPQIRLIKFNDIQHTYI